MAARFHRITVLARRGIANHTSDPVTPCRAASTIPARSLTLRCVMQSFPMADREKFMQVEDFRTPAAQASQRALQKVRLRSGDDVTQAGISYCLAREQAAGAVRTWMKIQAAGLFAIGLVLAFAGIAMLILGQTRWGLPFSPAIGIVSLVLGVLALSMLSKLDQRVAAAALRKRYPAAWINGTVIPVDGGAHIN